MNRVRRHRGESETQRCSGGGGDGSDGSGVGTVMRVCIYDVRSNERDINGVR